MLTNLFLQQKERNFENLLKKALLLTIILSDIRSVSVLLTQKEYFV